MTFARLPLAALGIDEEEGCADAHSEEQLNPRDEASAARTQPPVCSTRRPLEEEKQPEADEADAKGYTYDLCDMLR